MRVDVNREMQVLGNRLQRHIPFPKKRVKPLYRTLIFLGDRVIDGGKCKLKKILEAGGDAKGEWEL